MFWCASTVETVLIKVIINEFEMRTRYLFMLLVKNSLSVGLGFFWGSLRVPTGQFWP